MAVIQERGPGLLDKQPFKGELNVFPPTQDVKNACGSIASRAAISVDDGKDRTKVFLFEKVCEPDSIISAGPFEIEGAPQLFESCSGFPPIMTTEGHTSKKESVLRRKLTSFRHLLVAISRGEPSEVINAAWAGQTKPMTPDQKRATLLYYAKKFQTPIFVETGTYLGDSLQYLLPDFESLHSTELSAELFTRAQARFSAEPKIHLHQGDSADVLPDLIAQLNGRALIWLDAHYSAGFTACGPEETPIMQELRHVFANNTFKHIILIDDARDFVANPNYPPLHVVQEFAEKRGYSYECRFDLIRLVPQ